MSSRSLSPIVGLYGMLCVLAGSGAVLSPNGTIFEDNCKKTTTCEALKYNTCLGSLLPYTHTSLVLAEDSNSQEEAFEKLTMWSGKIDCNQESKEMQCVAFWGLLYSPVIITTLTNNSKSKVSYSQLL